MKHPRLEDLQAYIVLRGSLLSSEDKKRVLMDTILANRKTDRPRELMGKALSVRTDTEAAVTVPSEKHHVGAVRPPREYVRNARRVLPSSCNDTRSAR